MATNMNPPGGLLDLIEMKRAGRTNADLARLSGGHLKAPAISNLFAKGLKEFPSVASLRGYSLALGVSTGDVIQAAAISLGLNTGGAPAASNDLILSGAGALPEKSRAVLRDMAEHLLWWQAQEGTYASTEAYETVDKDSGEYRAMSVEERIAAAGVTEQGEVDLAAYAPGGKMVREQQEEVWAESEDQSPEDPDHVA